MTKWQPMLHLTCQPKEQLKTGRTKRQVNKISQASFNLEITAFKSVLQLGSSASETNELKAVKKKNQYIQ